MANGEQKTLSRAAAFLRSEEFLSLPREDQQAIIRMEPELAEEARRTGFRPGLSSEQAGPPLPPAQTAASRIPRPTPETLRNTLVAAGGALGTIGGLPAGPVGAVAGAGLGSAAASLASDVAGFDRSASVGQGIERAAQEGLFDVATGGIAARVPGAAQAFKRNLLGITEQSLETFEQAALQNVRLGAEQVSESGIVRRFRNVAGRFPLLAGPLQKGSRRLGEEGAASLQNTLDAMAPVAHFAEIGADLLSASQRKVGALRGTINRQYDEFRRLAQESDARVPLDQTRSLAADIIRRAREEGGISRRVIREAEKALRLGVQKDARGVEVKGPINVLRHRGATREIDRAIDQLRLTEDRAGAGELAQLRKALEGDLQNIQGTPEVREALSQANASFERFARLFKGTPQGRRLEKADPRLFTDFPRSPNAQAEVDRLYEATFRSQLDSPDAIRDLARLVDNPGVMREAARATIDRIGSDAIRIAEDTGQTFLNLRKLTADLGLFDARNPRRSSLVETLGKENVSNLENVVRALQSISDTNVVNVSDFVARRGLLGGARSVIRSFTPGLDASDNITEALKKVAGVVTFIVGGRRFGEMITNPQFMRELATAVRPNAREQARIAAMLRISRLAPELFDVEGTGEGLLPVSQSVPGVRGLASAANLLPLAGGLGASIPRTTRGAGRALAGVQFGEVIQDLESFALAASEDLKERGSRRGRELSQKSGEGAERLRRELR